MFLFWSIVVVTLILLYIKYIGSPKCESQVCLVGKTVIVTGANTGIGYEAALDFAMRGARVILACRNKGKAEEARDKIIEETSNKNVFVKLLNMASLDSVRKFAKEIIETEDRLDILCNNAGAAGVPNVITDDGLLLIMQVNYFSSFLLTNLLIDLLKKSAPSRIVNVSSVSAKRAVEFDVNNLNNFTGSLSSYSNTKLCNVLFTQECAKRLKGTGVTSYSLHPGLVMTDIWRRAKGILRIFAYGFGPIFFRTSREGAQTTLYVALTSGIEHLDGEHFVDCQHVEKYDTARDPILAAKLWENTIKLLKLDSSEVKI